MKLFLLTFLGSIAAASAGAAEDLMNKWKLSDPVITFDSDSNTFVFKYPDSSSLVTENGVVTQMYTYSCKEGDDKVDTGTTVTFDGFEASTTGGAIDTAALSLTVDTKIVSADPTIYKVIDATLRGLVDDDANPVYEGLTADDDDLGLVALCLRYSIGTPGATAADFYEVNFLETLIQIKYDLTAGFRVDGISVAPKAKSITTQAKDAYTLVAYLCDSTGATELENGRNVGVAFSQGASSFAQGALVSVCVKPDSVAVNDGIFIKQITEYFWIRFEASAPLPAGEFPEFDSAGGAGDIKQKSVPIASNGNGLSAITYPTALDGDNHFVLIQSILFADFYKSAGEVSGIGQATLKFAAARRMLKGSDADAAIEGRRQLQDDEPTVFDVSVGVTNDAEGPGALKTAGGASLGFTAMATAAALVSAALLA